jgi:hypothetical protein
VRRAAIVCALAALALATTGVVHAQMPDLRAVVGKPLPVPDLAPGTVSVRVARKAPANAVVGVEVSAVVKPPGGDSRKQTAKTGPDGRATFSGLAPGAEFQASATVDLEALESAKFTIPAQGGTRVMLIADLGAAPAEGAGGQAPSPHQGAAGNFRMGAVTGSVEPASDLPPGTLELELLDEQQKPLAGVAVRLGAVALDSPANAEHVKVHQAVSDAQGRARFEGLRTGAGMGYAAVFDRAGTRVSTEPFRMLDESGMRGKLLALTQTDDTSVLRIDNRSRIAIDVREDNVTVMMALVFQNVSKQSYDPGPRGLVVPLPKEAVSAQEIEGGAQMEIVADGAHIHTVIPPNGAGNFATQAMFGYVLPAQGSTSVEVRQPIPVLMDRPLIIVPEKSGLTVSAPGLEPLEEQTNRAGEKLKLFTVPQVPASGVLALTVSGVPSHDRSGARWVSVLWLLLVAAAIVWARPRGAARDAHAAKEALVQRRERLFADLLGLERRRRNQSAADPDLERRRRELMTSLDGVYRDLAEREVV